MNNQQPLALISGAGPGLGQSLMQSMAANSYTAVGLRRSKPVDAKDSENDICLQCDLSDMDTVRTTVERVTAQYGAPQLVIHNPATLIIKPFLDTSSEEFGARVSIRWHPRCSYLARWFDRYCR